MVYTTSESEGLTMRETLDLKYQVMCSVENFRRERKQLAGRKHPLTYGV